MKILFPGSFDPFTNAHLDVVERLSKFEHELSIGIFVNSGKNSFFTEDERVEIIEQTLKDNNIEAEVFVSRKLLAIECMERDITLIARGLRSIRDYEYEREMEFNNKYINPNLEYIYLNSSPAYNYVSSTVVRELMEYNENFSHLVPEGVVNVYKKKIR